MRQQFAVAVMLAALPLATQAAWVAISSDAGRRIEIDPNSVQKEGENKQIALGRILFAKELTDARSSETYLSIETLTRYDCTLRTSATLKRTWRKADGEMLRDEEIKTPAELPVRSGSLDDKLLREVCRPRTLAGASAAAQQVAEKANVAAESLRRANEAMIQQEVQKELKKAAKPAAKPAPPPKTNTETPAVAAAPKKAATPAAKAPAAAAPARVRGNIPWAYEGEGGPEHWGRLKTDYATCASGKRQSPIDIRDGIRVDLPAIDFSWQPTQFRIVDTGHTVRAALGGSHLSLLGKTYALQHVDFHRPAEERINGKGFEMSAHFVHQADDGRLAIVAVLIERGEENPFIQTLWNHLPLERNDPVAPPGVAVDPAKFLPAERGYYTYMGSLTTPPCTENVQWLVLKQPVQASAEQIAIFARLYRHNARPPQATHDRLIKESR
ncbi:MAG TPA: carbonic anhydrase family protein [Azospira sp.]|nr:carbonic anhydrase family protein [Azospira sp.]